eukprot:CAMPEP_0114347728 /NCGR_PEP_ID=MMETSP0101-20121206/14143_1 /TAXON_ID=38822 ORGANISM="Pteridomonas danica, Strain PT" /NCGR_SAMPLE_ID=MMETSP0101 /ASSEMBLY_ACC=CAM_ASM_000211 /LENGTH=162 /DNA_ID=CAMNT_0001485233 /DNA_START=89 /DNA_END=577 /DNA_ORIENTATION=+
MRKQECAQSQKWRINVVSINSGVNPNMESRVTEPKVPSSSIEDEETRIIKEKLKARVVELENEVQALKESKQKEEEIESQQVELPGMSQANNQADMDYTKFAAFETAISDQMDVIEKLTEEKRGISVELFAALKLVRQRDRENATLSYQLKELLTRLKASKK